MRRLLSSALVVLGVAGAISILIVAVSFIAVSDGSQDVAREGKIAIGAEATLSQAVVTWNTANQTIVLEEARAAGAIAPQTVTRSAAVLSVGIAEYQRRSAELSIAIGGAEGQAVATTAARLIIELQGVVDALEAPPGDEPRVEAIDESTYEAAVGTLVAVRDGRVQDVLVEAEYAGQIADGLRFLVTIAIPITAMLLLRSIMRRRRERDAMRSELERTQAVISSKDEFVANLSHELRTPLTGVYGFALALEESGAEDPDTTRELAGLIANDAAELSRMVDDLITAGQVETGNVVLDIQDVDIDAEIEAVIEPFLRSGANIEFTPSGDVAEADRLRFRQVVRNLVSNAVKHGGPNIDIFTEYGGGTLSVFVMDDGDGIGDEHLTQVFDRYQHEGTGPLLQGSVGLGLAIARSLAVGMGGNLSYTRTNGLTYFVFRLPAHRVGKLGERVDDQSLGDESAAKSASDVAKLFSR
ncbi:MAG: HAMP domain-containing sensor histidine kinase [Acidimicrobiia bacterium]|nr:HAMP domain-containing sensor histidine kinase [Acidimicrobiia bacterium]